MSEFVEGALTALVGAVVGGLAAGLVAWYQVRNTTQQQLEMLRRQQIQHAALEIAPVMEELGREFTARVRCDPPERLSPECKNSTCYKEVRDLRQRLERVFWIWVNWIPHPLRREIDVITDVIAYNRSGFDRFISELAEQFPDDCPRCRHFDALGGNFTHLAYDVMQLAAVRPSSF